MKLEEVICALRSIETYCAASALDELKYAGQVLEKLHREGVEDPLAADFTLLKQSKA